MSKYAWTKGELYHHGILGQKWGKLNGPPYPLGAEKHSAREIKEDYKRSKIGKHNEKMYDRNDKTKKQLTNEQKAKLKKAAIIGLSVAGTALVIYGAYKLSKTDAFKNLINKGETICEEKLLYGDNISSLEVPSEPLNTSNIVNRAIDAFDDNEVKMFDPEQLRKLSDDEMRALQTYTTNWYHDINHYLRKDSDVLRDPNIVKLIADNIKSAFNKVSLSSDVNVARGIDKDTSKNILLNPDIYQKLMAKKQEFGDYSGSYVLDELKGYMNKDPGIMSTSYNTKGSVIESFSGKDGIIVDMVAKKGIHGIVARPFSEAPYEKEVAFAPDSSIQFTGEYRIINGIVHLMAEIVQ